ESHHRLARLGFDPLRSLLGRLAFERGDLGAREAELRHSQALVPGLDAFVIVAARLAELLVQEPLALVVSERIVAGLFLRLLDVWARAAMAVLSDRRLRLGVVTLNIGDGVSESEPLGVFLTPVVEGGADWFGRFEAGDVVAAEAAGLIDRLAADVKLE